MPVGMCISILTSFKSVNYSSSALCIRLITQSRSPVDKYYFYPQQKLSTAYDQNYKVFIHELSF